MIQRYLRLVLLSTEPPYQTLVVQDVGTIAQLDASSLRVRVLTNDADILIGLRHHLLLFALFCTFKARQALLRILNAVALVTTLEFFVTFLRQFLLTFLTESFVFGDAVAAESTSICTLVISVLFTRVA